MRDARGAQRMMTAMTWSVSVVLLLHLDWSLPRRPVVVAALLAVAPIAALARFVDVDVRLRRGSWPFRTVDAVLGAGLVLHPGAWWALLLILGTAAGLLTGRLPRAAVNRNVGQLALAIVVATSIGGLAVAGSPLAARLIVLSLAVLAYAGVTHLLNAIGVAATVRRPVSHVLRGRGLQPPAQTVAGTLLGVLCAGQLAVSPTAVVLLAVAAGLIVLLRRQQRRHDADLQMYAELVRGQEQASGRSVDVSAEVVLGAAARLLGGADCELLVRHPGGPVRFAGNEYGVRERVPVTGAEFDRPWVLRVLGAPAARVGVDEGRPYVAAAVGRGTPWAVLIARRPLGARAFGRADRRRLLALTDQAETWLAVSELTGWDTPYDTPLPAGLGPTARPALRSLRDASRRLAGLAQRWDSSDPVVDVVTEMQSCEHAVTELLGAVSGRPVPLLGGAPRPAAGQLLGPVEWTSTGTVRVRR